MNTQPQKTPVDFTYCGVINGHNDAVTCICTEISNPEGIIVSSSRDGLLIVWKVTPRGSEVAIPVKSLQGHGHFVSDVKISHNSAYAISSSWDKTLRLWDLTTGKSVKRFVGHTKEVLSVSFSALDNRQIVSGSADRTIKLWNTLGECKVEFSDKGHQDWVTCVRFSPSPDDPTVVSCGRDGMVKVWDMGGFSLKMDFTGHKGYLNCVTVSPDGTLCASGGQDGTTMLWDLCEAKYLYCLEPGNILNALAFSPTRYWLCTASGYTIKVWDLEERKVISELVPDHIFASRQPLKFACTALAWSSNGSLLYAGYSDGSIRLWRYSSSDSNNESDQLL